MATKNIELILELLVKDAGGDLGKITAGLDAIVQKANSLKSAAQLRDLLGISGAVDRVNALKAALEGLRNARALGEIARDANFLFNSLKQMQSFKLDIDTGRLQNSLTTIAHEANTIYQSLVKLGKTKLDFDVTKANKDLDLLVQKGKQLIDLPLTLAKGKPLDLNLGDMEAKLNKANRAARQLREEKEKVGKQTQQNTEHFRLFNTALGNAASQFLFLRRVFIALLGVNFAEKILDTVKAFDKLNQSLKAVFATNAPQELKFVQETADRLGLSVTDLATNWAKFAASVDPAKVSMQVMRENFLAVAEAGAILGLSTEEINGALTALSQIASKGRLSMEELRQQLGDRLPGAVRIAAEALGLTQAKLFALIEQGKISSDVFLNAFPKALRASFGTDQTTRVETLGAAITRFQNSLKELINAAVRSGALDVFRGIIDRLAERFKDPAFVATLQEIANSIAKIGLAAVGAAKPLAILFTAFVGFKTITGVKSIIAELAEAFVVFSTRVSTAGAALRTFTPTVAAATQATTAGAAATAQYATGLGAFNAVVGSAVGLIGALTLAYIAGKAAADAWVDSLIEGEQRVNKINEAIRESESAGRLSGFFAKQAVDLAKYGDVSILAADQIKALSTEQAQLYQKGVEGATALADAQRKQAEQGIKQAQEELKALQLRGDSSEAARKRIDELLFTISRLRDVQQEATTRGAELAGAFAELEKRGDAVGLSFELSAETLKRIADAAANAAPRLAEVGKISLERLNKETRFIVDGFQQATEKGEAFAKAIETALPKNWLEGTTKSISDVGNALGFLVQEGLLPASAAADELAKDLSKLSADKIAEFGIKTQVAFDAAQLSAQGFATLLDSQVRASLNKLGIDAEFAGKNINKQFSEMTGNFANLAGNVRATAEQIKEGLDITISAAKTREELQLISSTVDALGLRTGKFSKELEDAFLRLDDKIRLTAGTLNSALGDSFERLGVKSKLMLSSLADQAVVDFNRIKNSGIASALEVEAAFRKMAEQVTAATRDGIPPIELRFAAINNNAFDILVKSAELAGARVKKAIEDAIPLADTLEKLRVLRDGIQTTFEQGRLSAADFAEEMTRVGFAIREAGAKPVGEVVAAMELFGVKTKEQLQAVADNSKEAFQIMASSGQFTTGELVKAAQQYMDAYKAANEGVTDSFDPVLEKAQEVLASVNQFGEKVDQIKGLGSDPIAIGNLRDMSIQELQQEMADLSKAFRAIGIQNVQDLQIIQAIQKELQRQALIDQDARKKALEEATALMNQAADNISDTTQELQQSSRTPTPTGGGALGKGDRGFTGQAKGLGGDTININLNGAGQITSDEIKRKVVPALRVQQLRRR